MSIPSLQKPTAYQYLLLCFVVSLAASYLPVITFGVLSGVHVDATLLYVVTIGFVVTTLALMTHYKQLRMQLPITVISIFAGYSTLSILWTSNPIRGIITSLFLWLMIGLVVSMQYATVKLLKIPAIVLRVLLFAYLAVVAIVLWQLVGDATGLSPQLTLLPEQYRSTVFGVARPVGLALEPQFLASLLIFPLLGSAWRVLSGARDKLSAILLISASSLLLLTISRGGILAATIGLTVLLVCIRPHWKIICRTLFYGLISIIVALFLQFALASINVRDSISGTKAVANIIEQLSLGIIKLPETDSAPASTAPLMPTDSTQPTGGYVASSTDSRTTMLQNAIKLWATSLMTFLFGVGSGGFGTSLAAHIDTHATSGTVANNFYAEMLAELGLIGTALFVTFLVYVFVKLIKRRQWLFVALLVAFLVQWNYFSGNANVIHVWAMLGIVVWLGGSAMNANQLMLRKSLL